MDIRPTNDSYSYTGTITKVLNEDLPRVCLTIAGKGTHPLQSPLVLAGTFVLFQTTLGTMSIIIASAAKLRPAQCSDSCIRAFSALSSAIQVAVSNATRALDKPGVSL